MAALRLFTLEEANRLIPRLELIMEKLQRKGMELREGVRAVASDMDRPLAEVTLEEVLAQRPALKLLTDDMQQLVGEIEGVGVQFKGLDLGLVDFPSEIDGEVRLLCWQYGEKEIAYWHSPETGFAGRQPLPDVRLRSVLQ
jgi:hypothetical protein